MITVFIINKFTEKSIGFFDNFNKIFRKLYDEVNRFYYNLCYNELIVNKFPYDTEKL